ncbi:3-methyladenine DNA glycosylase [Nesterenkonia sp. HG001]|uniref:DNA-3-methyladenine glycosylase family protein n=1 Tax=Nesterenkonia sp. HG001 TaxID=2983207 RepID=UPI002ACC1331|nr:3-methyladenine DNA glycosylase [Nesterenkonia sp. HG001]
MLSAYRRGRTWLRAAARAGLTAQHVMVLCFHGRVIHQPSAGSPDGELIVDLGTPYDLPRSLEIIQRGAGDPAFRVDPVAHRGGSGGTPGAGAWACFRLWSPASALEQGQALLRLDQVDATRVRARAWCAGAEASPTELARTALARVPALLGAEDDWAGFELLLEASDDEQSAGLERIRRRHPGVRLPSSGQLLDQLVTVVLEQKVTHDQARHGWRQLLRRHGERPPGPAPAWMRLPLTARQLHAVPSWEWHQMWVQPPMAATIRRVAERASALHRLAGSPAGVRSVEELAGRLTAIDGVGPWTAAEALQRTHGAADLLAVGDYHLPALVGEALTGSRTDDAGMLRILRPWRGHRQRVVRLIRVSGYRHQKFGPRLSPADHRSR